MKKLFKLLNKLLIVYIVFIVACCGILWVNHTITVDELLYKGNYAIEHYPYIKIEFNEGPQLFFHSQDEIHDKHETDREFYINSWLYFNKGLIPEFHIESSYDELVKTELNDGFTDICNEYNVHYAGLDAAENDSKNVIFLHYDDNIAGLDENSYGIQLEPIEDLYMFILVNDESNWENTKTAAIMVYDAIEEYAKLDAMGMTVHVEALTLKDGAEPIYNIEYGWPIIEAYESNSELLHELIDELFNKQVEDAFEMVMQ